MFRRIAISYFLIFTTISCHYKTEKVTDNKVDSISAICSDKIGNLNLTASEETIVEKYEVDKEKIADCQNPSIELNDLGLLSSNNECYFITVVLLNNTTDSIFLSNNTFLYYSENNKSWSALPYPENFVKEDLGTFIAPNTKQCNKFFFPINDKNPQGKYKLQLSFYARPGKTLYYISKIFIIK